jgi:hypothetical protein
MVRALTLARLILLPALFGVGTLAAHALPLTVEDVDTGGTFEAVDGIVGVEHLVGDSARVRSDAQRTFPGWRANYFAWPGASAEVRTFSFFAHPGASAELLGFSPHQGAGAPPPIEESLARALALLEGDIVVSPYFSGQECGLSGRVQGSAAWVRFDVAKPIDEELSLLDEVGAILYRIYPPSPPYYHVRFPQVRSALELFALVEGLDSRPDIAAAPDLWRFGMFGCQGPSGAPSSGPRLPPVTEPPAAIPMLEPRTLILQSWILLVCALVLLRHRS